VSGVQVIVVGAGPAGMAAEARRNGLIVEVLEATDSVAASWRGHYDRLHLHTTRGLSGLPGHAIPKEMGRWVARDNFVSYLEAYARDIDVPISCGVRVQRIDRSGRPAFNAPASADGLFFIGYSNPISGNRREIAMDARRLGRVLAERAASTSAAA